MADKVWVQRTVHLLGKENPLLEVGAVFLDALSALSVFKVDPFSLQVEIMPSSTSRFQLTLRITGEQR